MLRLGNNSSKEEGGPVQGLSNALQPWQRSFQFWVRATDVYLGYKAFQFRVGFVKDKAKQKEMWERQHQIAADKLYSMCSELGGFFLKAAQLVGKPDLAPAAWVKRLVTLCDRAPPTPFDVVQTVLEEELGGNFRQLFEKFDEAPIGSASIAQVHRARIKGRKGDVAVKVQHPGVKELMMADIRNLRAFATFLQKEIKFDVVSVTYELEKQVGYEFDFLREADSMKKIQHFLSTCNKKSPVTVPRVISEMTTRRVLLMEFIDGTPIMNLGEEMAKRGINPGGKVALLDYGQVKHITNRVRLAYANLVVAMVTDNPLKASESFRELGIGTSECPDGSKELLKLARGMFDTKLPPHLKAMTPFSDDSALKKLSVKSFPEELFFVLRTVNLLRGLSVGLGINYSCAEQWKPIAEEALSAVGSQPGKLLLHSKCVLLHQNLTSLN
ncbi:putative aarF domain-containing protein kinase [Nymphaea thermarum]|nr:putative aarF domain-containing protein kinase [Nymphaea thermarum]